MNSISVNQEKNKRTGVKFSLQSMLMLMAAIMMALATLTSCDEDEDPSDDPDEIENGGNGTDPNSPNSFPEKAAVKYLWVSHLSESGETVHSFVTFNDYAKKYRYDWYGPIKDGLTGEYITHYDHWESDIVITTNKTHWKSIYAGAWNDEPYKSDTKIDPSITMTAQELLSLGYVKQSAQRTFAGKPCDIYISTNSYGTSTYGLWNNINLYVEVEASYEGVIAYTKWEALAVNLDVPEVAFTKTLDITWLPK